jgi:hypothetical protein
MEILYIRGVYARAFPLQRYLAGSIAAVRLSLEDQRVTSAEEAPISLSEFLGRLKLSKVFNFAVV